MMNLFVKQIHTLESEHPNLMPTIYQIMSSFFFALNHFSVKFFHGIPVTQVIVWRCTLTLVIVQFLNKSLPVQTYPTDKSASNKLIARASLGIIGLLSCFIALKLVPVSEAVVMMKTNPLWTTLILVYILKKEKLTFRTIIEIVVCIIGVICITKPPFIFGIQNSEYSILHFIGLCLALTCAVEASIAQIIIKQLNNKVHSFVVLQYFSVFAIAGSVTFQLYSPFEQMRYLSLREAGIVLFSGLLGCLGQIFMNRGMMLGKVTQMALVGESQIVFNILLDLLVLKQVIQPISWIGIGLIASSLTSNIIKKS